MGFGDFVEGLVDSTPGLGHIKGGFHYLEGDPEKGNKAMYRATRSTGVVVGGVIGCAAGPAGAAGGAMAGGHLVDTATSIFSGKSHGNIEHIENILYDLDNHPEALPYDAALLAVDLGFDAYTGRSMNSRINGSFTFNDYGNIVRNEMYRSSLGMGSKGLKKKVIKSGSKYLMKEGIKGLKRNCRCSNCMEYYFD